MGTMIKLLPFMELLEGLMVTMSCQLENSRIDEDPYNPSSYHYQ